MVAGISPDQTLVILQTVAGTLTGSRNLSENQGNLSDFFEILVDALAKAGHGGTRAAPVR